MTITVQFNKESNRFNLIESGVIINWYANASNAYKAAEALNYKKYNRKVPVFEVFVNDFLTSL